MHKGVRECICMLHTRPAHARAHTRAYMLAGAVSAPLRIPWAAASPSTFCTITSSACDLWFARCSPSLPPVNVTVYSISAGAAPAPPLDGFTPREKSSSALPTSGTAGAARSTAPHAVQKREGRVGSGVPHCTQASSPVGSGAGSAGGGGSSARSSLSEPTCTQQRDRPIDPAGD